MENDTPNQTTNQLLIQHISEAALLTDPDFAMTACNPAALALFLYNQQDILRQSFSFLLSTASKTNIRETERTRLRPSMLNDPGLPFSRIRLLNQKRINKATNNPFMMYTIIMLLKITKQLVYTGYLDKLIDK